MDKEPVFIPDTVQSSFVPFVYDPEAVCKIINGESGDIVCDDTEYYLPKPHDDPLGGETSVRESHAEKYQARVLLYDSLRLNVGGGARGCRAALILPKMLCIRHYP